MHEDSVCKHFGLGCPHETCIGTRKKIAMEQSPLLAVDKPRIELLAQKVNHRPSLSVWLILY